MVYPTDLIPISQKSGGICIRHKLGKLIGLSMMDFYASCKKFLGCNLSDFNIIWDESPYEIDLNIKRLEIF